MQELVTEMEKGFSEKIVFSFSEYKGKHYVGIRVYYEDDEGEWKPTKKGISIGIDRYFEFKDHLGELEEYLRTEGHLTSAEGN